MPSEVIRRVEYPGGGVFEIVVGDLLAEPTEAIVNAANGHLAHGGGVAAVISRAAGPALDEEGFALVRERGPVATGGAAATTAGRLPFLGVIHAVGPVMGSGDEEATIVAALRSAFSVAAERGWTSVSFPGISAGVFAVPHAICAKAYRRAIEEHFAGGGAPAVRWIRLVLLRGPLLEAVRREWGMG